MRLSHPSIRAIGHTVTFRFDGTPIQALEGETVAAALSAAGVLDLRATKSGAPRGLFCGMGACFDCVVTIDGQPGQRACMTRAADGMAVERAVLVPSAEPPPTPPSREEACDVLVVGGGIAGLSAAIAAASAGCDVVLLDERTVPGGQYAKALALSHADDKPDRQFRIGNVLRGRTAAAGVWVETDALVWGAFAADEIAAVVQGQAVTYRPLRLILATGAHEAPVPIPGWTLPGVMTTGGLQGLVRSHRVCPGERVLIAGSGPLNLQLACEMLAAGIRPVAVLEAASRPGRAAIAGFGRMARTAPDLLLDGARMLWRLRRAGVPVLWGTELERLEGDGRVRTAVAGTRRFAVDVVALNRGFQPEVGVARALGAEHRIAAGRLETVTDRVGRTSRPGVFSVGDGAAFGGARVARARGRLAGMAAAMELGRPVAQTRGWHRALDNAATFQAALWRVFAAPDPAPVADDVVVCRCEEITAGRLRAEVAGGLTSLAALKKATRAGMGRCQGRYCAATVARLCPLPAEPDGFAAPRAPLRPVPIAPLMHEAPEFVAPLLTEPSAKQVLHPLPEMPAETRQADIVVIGGGVAGLATAYFLARDGADVLVIDRDEAAMAASTANAGSLHVQLLSYDFTDDTPPDGGPAAHTLSLAPRSIALWKQVAAEAGEDLGIRQEGGLMLAEDEAGLAWLRRKSEMERRCGIESHVIGHNELRDLAPALSDRMLGADFVPAEGYGDPLRGMMALLRLAREHGTRLLRGADVHAIERHGLAWAVHTSKGTVTAGTVVNATGPWAARIGRMVGLDLPVTGTVQQVIVTDPVPPITRHLIAVAKRHLSLKQQASGGFLIGGGWFGGFDPDTGRTFNLRRSIEGNLWICGQVLPVVRSLSMVRAWTGINVAIDRAPLLGEALPGFWNVVTANGYTLGPAVAEITAAAIRQGESINPQFRIERFG